MTIITASNSKYKKFVKVCISQAEKFGYKTLVYNLGNLGFGISFEGDWFSNRIQLAGALLLRCVWKSQVILDAFERSNDDKMIWLDSDAILANSVDEVFIDNNFDVAVTLRPARERNTRRPELTGFINAGVIFFRNNESSRRFVNEWNRITEEEAEADQHALNILVGKATDWTKRDITVQWNGVKIRILKTENYNWYYQGEHEFDAKENKIIHFKGNKRPHFPKFLSATGVIDETV